MAFTPKPIEQLKTSQIIAKQLTKAIENGDLKPGDKLPAERILAQQLNVSRTSLREALRALEITGMINSRVGDGTFVSKTLPTNMYSAISEMISLLEEASADEIIEARKPFECQVVRLAAQRATSEDIKKLESIIQQMHEELRQGKDGLDKDKEFHLCIAEATHNRVFIQFMNDIVALMGAKIWNFVRDKILEQPGHSKSYFEEHRAIYLAIKERNPDKAHRAMEDHMNRVEKDIEEI
ncbi:MAG: FadR/GntR family transcriptional regulator [Bacillota bacterium]